MRSKMGWLVSAVFAGVLFLGVTRTIYCQSLLLNFDFNACLPLQYPGFLFPICLVMGALLVALLRFFNIRLKQLGIFLVIALILLDPRALGIFSRNAWGVIRFFGLLFLVSLVWPFGKKLRLRTPLSVSLPLYSIPLQTLFSALGIFLLIFILYTFPLLLEFNTHLFADGGDGMQMVWNLWWFHKALSKHLDPFFTSYLHYPLGATLLGASYHPLKSLLVAPFVPILGIAKAYNLLFIETFLACALACFCLAYALTRSFIGAISAGVIFGFWSNRFAHANGHMHVMSGELVPLFLLSVLYYLRSPSLKMAALTALCLFGSLLIDHYSFLFNLFLLASVLVWLRWREKTWAFLRSNTESILFFLFLCGITSGLYILWMFRENYLDPWSGAHSAHLNSMDLFALFIPGAFSWLGFLTPSYWKSISAGSIEGSVSCGISVALLAFFSSRALRKGANEPIRSLLVFLFSVFFLLALGPYLQCAGWTTPFSLPYLFLQKSVPPLRISGVPVRMACVVILVLAVFVALQMQRWNEKGDSRRSLFWFLLILVELFPVLPSRTPISIPPHIAFLQQLPDDSPIIDIDSFMTTALYYQTIHEKPLAFGYIARVPASREKLEKDIRQRIDQHDFLALKHYGFRYLLMKAGNFKGHFNLKEVYRDPGHVIFEIL